MLMPKIYSQFHLPPRKDIVFTEPSLTEQSFKFESDINNICEGKAFSSLPANKNQPLFDDFTNLGNYQESLDIVARAKSLFEELPSNLRNRFENNPQKLIDFVSDPEKNYDEGVKLGIFNPKVVETPIKVEIAKGNDNLPKNNFNPVNGSPEPASGSGVSE